MKSIDLPTAKCGSTTIRHMGPIHYYPDTGEVYDVVGNYLGQGTMSGGILVITPESNTPSWAEP